MSRFRSDNELTVTTGRDGHRSFSEHDDRWAPRSRGRGGGGKYRSGRGGQYGRDNPGRGGGGRNYLSRGPRGIAKREKSVHFNPRTRLDDDGDDAMGLAEGSLRGGKRFNPYSSRTSNRRDRQGRGSFRERNTVRFNTSKSDSDWYKITIPHGKKHDKDYLLKTLQSLITGTFCPVQFHYESNNAVFHINEPATANSIRAASHKTTLTDGFKLITVVTRTSSPTIPSLTNEVKDKLKVVMSSRYNPTTKVLDLGSLHQDTSLQGEGLYMALNRMTVMTGVIDIVTENIPEMTGLILKRNKLYSLRYLKDMVNATPNLRSLDLSENELKTVDELDKIKGWSLEELNLNLNVLCDTFQDRASYISAVRKRFSKILNLDGNVLPPTIKFDLDTSTSLPPSKGSFFSDDNLKALIVKFLSEFYSFYDSDNRHPLINAYHDQASFSLATCYNGAMQYKQSNLNDYTSESRNLIKTTKNLDKNFRLLKNGKLVIVSQLCLLPKTTHDPDSFVVDVGLVSPNMMSFAVSGVFKETDSKTDKPPVRAFSRQFVAVPSGSGILITNDMLTITNALPEQQQSAFKHAGPTPSSSTVPSNRSALHNNMSITEASTSTGSSSITPQQQQMIQQFTIDSKMNVHWSTKCLEENLWNYEKAGQIFLELSKNGKIPPGAFVK